MLPKETIAQAMLEGVRALGISLSPAEERFRTRVALLRSAGEDLPDMSDDSLLSSAQEWLLPYLAGIKTASPTQSAQLCLSL